MSSVPKSTRSRPLPGDGTSEGITIRLLQGVWANPQCQEPPGYNHDKAIYILGKSYRKHPEETEQSSMMGQLGKAVLGVPVKPIQSSPQSSSVLFSILGLLSS